MSVQRRLAFRSVGVVLDEEIAGLVGSYRKTGNALKYRRIGKKVVPWRPRSGFVYSQVRAISARINQNYDAWPSEELKKSHKTFVGKPIFVNHTNEDPKTARGVVVAARYVEKGADKYVECIMETDAKRFPKLGHEIRTGGMDSVSMGVEAGFTICSVCENRATDLTDMCDHIMFHKGEYFRNKKTGKKIMAYENCFKLGFFELSYVFDPADETAVVSRVIAAGRKEAGGLLKFPTTSDEQFAQDLMHEPGPDKPPPQPSPLSHIVTRDGHGLAVYGPRSGLNAPGDRPGTGAEPRHEWVHTYQGQPVDQGYADSLQDARLQLDRSYSRFPLRVVRSRKFSKAYWLKKAGIAPPAVNAQYTTVMNTRPTYPKAHDIMTARGAAAGPTIDYGAGDAGVFLAPKIGHETFEPFPNPGYKPNYKDPEEVPKGKYNRLTSLNVLNTISDPGEREAAVRGMGDALAPGGHAVVTTRGWTGDVQKSKPHPDFDPPEEPNAVITGPKNRPRFQKGFFNTRQNPELTNYVQGILGDGYTVRGIPLGGAGVHIVRNAAKQASSRQKKRGGLMRRQAYGRHEQRNWLTQDEITHPFQHQPSPAGNDMFVPEGFERLETQHPGMRRKYDEPTGQYGQWVARRLLANALAHTDWADVGRRSFDEGGPPEPHRHPEVSRATRHLDSHSPEVQHVHDAYQHGYQMAQQAAMPRPGPVKEPAVGLGGYPGGYNWNPATRSRSKDRSHQHDKSRNRVVAWYVNAGHPPLSGKASCHECWGNSQERSGDPSAPDYLSLLRDNHQDELARHFQKPTQDVPVPKNHHIYEPRAAARVAYSPDPDEWGCEQPVHRIPRQEEMREAPWPDPPRQPQPHRQPVRQGSEHQIDESAGPHSLLGESPLIQHWKHEHPEYDPPQLQHQASWYIRSFGEVEAPEDIDTLRDESEDDTDLFHHWVQSPPELRSPDMDETKRLDRDQEDQGLDKNRNAEDAEPVSMPYEDEQQFRDDEEPDRPAMPMNPPEYKKGRRVNRGAVMSRYYYAADDDDDSGDESAGSDDIGSLLDEAEKDIEAYEGGDDGGGDDDGFDEEGDDSGGDFGGGQDEGEDDESGDEDDGGEDEEASGDTAPPWAEKESYFRPTVRRRQSRGNKRGGTMRTTLASRNPKGRHFYADDGYTDGGVHGEYDGSGADESQGLQEEVFISQVPSAEAVEAPRDDSSQIPNSPGNLVATRRPEFDPAHYQRLADVVRALPPAQRRAMADRMVNMFTSDNRAFNWRTFFEAANVPVVKKGNRYFYAEGLEDPDKVDPALSGTDVKDLKGNDFESLALENVETQPKDASIHKFQSFDQWLYQVTGRTAAQHGNANYISRMAASYCKQFKNADRALQGLFPTLEYVLHEARKVEGRNAMRRRAEDQSLETAAPDGRIDVESPVKNVTDAEAQASQFNLSDFAHNAGDQLADPVLDVVDGNAGTWAPDKGKESSRKLASGTEAMRCAEAYVNAMPNTYRTSDRWRLAAMFEGKLASAVRADLRLLEAVVEDTKKAPRKTARTVTAAGSRGTNGIKGIGSAGSRRTSASRNSSNDPDTDAFIFM